MNFLDTNILIYAATGVQSSPAKHRVALEIVGEGNFAVSTQVLQEFYVNVIRRKPGRKPVSVEIAKEMVERFSRQPIADTDKHLVLRGIEICQRYQNSYWDAAIIAAAERLDCDTVLSEDLSSGQRYGTVTVRDPFVE